MSETEKQIITTSKNIDNIKSKNDYIDDRYFNDYGTIKACRTVIGYIVRSSGKMAGNICQ
jgi:hypothetical protein